MPPQRTTKGPEDSKTDKRVGRKRGGRQVIHMENSGGTKPGQSSVFRPQMGSHASTHIAHHTRTHTGTLRPVNIYKYK